MKREITGKSIFFRKRPLFAFVSSFFFIFVLMTRFFDLYDWLNLRNNYIHTQGVVVRTFGTPRFPMADAQYEAEERVLHKEYSMREGSAVSRGDLVDIYYCKAQPTIATPDLDRLDYMAHYSMWTIASSGTLMMLMIGIAVSERNRRSKGSSA